MSAMSEPKEQERQEELWQTALKRAGLGVWDWDLATGNCFYSATWSQMLGYAHGELQQDGDLWIKLTHPEDRERAIKSGDLHLAGLTERIETELRLRHRDGHWVWVLDRGGVIERDEAGKPLRVIGVQTDISRQKAAELEVEEVNSRFRLALEASGIGIWHHNISAATSIWDERTCEIFGMAGPAEVSGDLWETYLHPEDRDRATAAHSAAAVSPQASAVRRGSRRPSPAIAM